MKTAPLVSIIIPYFNSHAYFKDLIISITTQSIQDIEIIIVDDNSKPESFVLLEEITHSFPKLTFSIVKNKKNLGVAVSRNQGFAQSSGRYILFIDADDLLCGRFSLEQRVRFLEQNETFAGIGGYALRIGQDGNLLVGFLEKTTDFFREGVFHPEDLRQIYCHNILENSGESASALFFATGSCLFRKEALADFPFDPKFETEEDIEFLLRFLDKNKIKLTMIPFHCRRMHNEQYHLRTQVKATAGIKTICKEILKTSRAT